VVRVDLPDSLAHDRLSDDRATRGSTLSPHAALWYGGCFGGCVN